MKLKNMKKSKRRAAEKAVFWLRQLYLLFDFNILSKVCFKWTNLKYDKLEKGKIYALPIENDDIYFEVLEVVNITKLTVKAVLYNWNKKGGEYPFANYLTVKKTAKDGVKITITDSKILEKKELSQAPQVYCDAVSERIGYGKIKSKNSSEMALIKNYGIASEKGEDVKIKNMIVDKKTGEAKLLMEFDEKKKQKKDKNKEKK